MSNKWKLISETKCETCNGIRYIIELNIVCPDCKGQGILFRLYMGTPHKEEKKAARRVAHVQNG